MPKNFEIIKAPESEQLRAKRDELHILEEDLAYGELEFHTLKFEMDSFHLLYMQIVGLQLAELDSLNDQIAEIEFRLKPLDEKLRQAAEAAHTRAEESWRSSNHVLKKEPGSQPTEDLKKLYWEVARKIHPDLSTDESDKVRRQQLMVEANVAFETGDEEKLREILKEWVPLESEGNGETSELRRADQMIARVQRRLEEIQLKITEIKHSELAELLDRVKAAKNQGRDLLRDMSQEICTNIILVKHRLKIISGQVNNAS